MTEEDALKRITEVMGTFGIQIQRIPDSKVEKRPDFEFDWGDEHFVVEMKQREAEWYLTKSEVEQLESGEIVERSESIGFHHRFAEKVEKASKQIAAYKPTEETFRLVWYWVYGGRAGLACQRVITTLLGDVWVVELGTERQWHAHFFDDNLFVQLGDAIDGAIVAQPTDTGAVLELVFNPHSCRYPRLKTSNFAMALSQGTTDSFAMEEAGDVLIVDSKADRSSERATLNYLGEKYGINVPQIIRMGSMAGIIRPEALARLSGASEGDEQQA
jgi:hypothetical protein